MLVKETVKLHGFDYWENPNYQEKEEEKVDVAIFTLTKEDKDGEPKDLHE